MKNSLETRLGLFVALVMLAAFFILVIVGGVEKFQRGLRAHALFHGVQELKVGDRVKMAGVEIGKVERISFTNDNVLVTMKLRRKIDGNPVVVKTDAIATVKFAGLMGQSFVSLDFGTPNGKVLQEGQYINTAEQADISTIMQKVDTAAEGFGNMTKGFAGDEIHNLMSLLTEFMSKNKDPFSATISNLDVISSNIVAGQGTVGKLIFDVSPTNLYNSTLTTVSNLQSAGDEMKLTLADARKIIDNMNAGEGSLGKMLKDDKLYTETTTAMTNLKEILQKMNGGQGTVGKLINDQEFYKNAKLTLQKIDKATEELEDSGPLSVLNAVVGKLF